MLVLAAASALLIPANSSRAYVPMRWGTAGTRGSWPAVRFPIAFAVHDDTAKGMPNLAPGSDVLAAFRAALHSWQGIQTAAIRFSEPKTTAADTAASDGMNLITMAGTAVNREILGGDQGAVALTRLVFDPDTGEIFESDILLNPAYRFSTDLTPGTYDLQSILTHELGHALGCDHAAGLDDTMFHTAAPEEFHQRHLSADAVAFASSTYPDKARVNSLGSISGRITSMGKGIFGASVTAVHLDRNLVYASLSGPDGSFAIQAMASGKYAVYAEPLDGPATPEDLMVQGGGAYYRGLHTTFRTVFAGDRSLGTDGAPRNLKMDLVVPSGIPTLNLDRMGRGDPDSGLGYLADGSAVVHPGETLSLWLGGADLWKVSGIGSIRILGTGLSLDAARGVRTLRNVSGAEVGVSVLLHVAPDAAPGPRTVTIQVGDQQVASTGGILVAERSLPAVRLHFPYLIASPAEYTGIALANPAAEVPATVRIFARDPGGALLWSEDAVIPAAFTLAGRTQSARLERQILNLPMDSRQAGSLSAESDNGMLQGCFLGGDLAGAYLDGAEAFLRGYRQLYFVDVLQNGNTSTEIHLMNIADVPVSVDLALVLDTGETLKITRYIPAGGKIGDTVSSLFGFSGVLRAGHLLASTAADTLAGFGLVRQKDAVFGLNALPPEAGSAMLFSPQLAVGALGVHYNTRLNVLNAGASVATVTVALLDENGSQLHPGAYSVELAPGRHFSADLHDFFGLEQAQGYIRVSAPAGSKLLGNVLFGDGDPTAGLLHFGAALPLSVSGSTSFVFPHVAQGNGYYTGVAFLAPGGARLKADVYDASGRKAGSASLDLAPNLRIASLLEWLIPETAGQVGGYIEVTSDRPVIGFELFGTTDGKVLSAVPLQRLSK